MARKASPAKLRALAKAQRTMGRTGAARKLAARANAAEKGARRGGASTRKAPAAVRKVASKRAAPRAKRTYDDNPPRKKPGAKRHVVKAHNVKRHMSYDDNPRKPAPRKKPGAKRHVVRAHRVKRHMSYDDNPIFLDNPIFFDDNPRAKKAAAKKKPAKKKTAARKAAAPAAKPAKKRGGAKKAATKPKTTPKKAPKKAAKKKKAAMAKATHKTTRTPRTSKYAGMNKSERKVAKRSKNRIHPAARTTRTTWLDAKIPGRRITDSVTKKFRKNPAATWAEVGIGIASTVGFYTLADLADRYLATRTPKGGDKPLYGADAAVRLLAKPDAMRLGVQAAGMVLGLGGAAYLARRMPKIAALIGGLGMGFGLKLGTMAVVSYLMPMILKSNEAGDGLGDRVFPLQQAKPQAFFSNVIAGTDGGAAVQSAFSYLTYAGPLVTCPKDQKPDGKGGCAGVPGLSGIGVGALPVGRPTVHSSAPRTAFVEPSARPAARPQTPPGVGQAACEHGVVGVGLCPSCTGARTGGGVTTGRNLNRPYTAPSDPGVAAGYPFRPNFPPTPTRGNGGDYWAHAFGCGCDVCKHAQAAPPAPPAPPPAPPPMPVVSPNAVAFNTPVAGVGQPRVVVETPPARTNIRKLTGLTNAPSTPAARSAALRGRVA